MCGHSHAHISLMYVNAHMYGHVHTHAGMARKASQSLGLPKVARKHRMGWFLSKSWKKSWYLRWLATSRAVNHTPSLWLSGTQHMEAKHLCKVSEQITLNDKKCCPAKTSGAWVCSIQDQFRWRSPNWLTCSTLLSRKDNTTWLAFSELYPPPR